MNYTYLFFLILFFINGAPPAKEKQPNIIVLFCDDLGYGDLGVYGHPTIHTPNLDNMAAQGMKFTNFYSGSPACTASRYALLTGRYPVRSGFSWVLMPLSAKGIHPNEYTLAEGLKDAGYATGCFGKWHLGTARPEYSPLNNGFDEYLGLPYSNDMIPPIHGDIALLDGRDTVTMNPDQSTLTRAYTDRAIQFLKKNKDGPFFIYLPYAMPHVPLYPGAAFAGKSSRGVYGDVVEEIDWSVGEIWKAVKEEGLLEETIILFTSDNGPWLTKKENGGSAGLLKDGKGSTWEGGMRVPAIALWEGKTPPSTICENIVSVIDLHSTFLHLAGHANAGQPEVDGKNVSKILLGERLEDPDRLLFYYGQGRNKLTAVRNGPWKLHVSTSSQLGHTYFDKKMPLLFNLNTDPSEQYECSNDHPEIVAELFEAIALQRQKINQQPDFFTLEEKANAQHHLAYGKKAVFTRPPSKKYGTAKALTNGILKTPQDYHDLPGFHGEDMEVVIDLGKEQSIKTLEAGFLEVHNSWIFLPQRISWYGSVDGNRFEIINSADIAYPLKARIHKTHYFTTNKALKYRWIKLVATNIETCPPWHYGKGEPAWIFCDEIIIR